ncbi:MAG: isoprenylcysteine carboxylmethyltransferase family protein [Bacteroidetes bacterium]|nr:isoprenylcysteine carboxylmethyltransferase family protein [Bacteroidota bacterium]
MLKTLYKKTLQLIDGGLYGFIGPFCVLYIVPQFLMKILPVNSTDGFGIPGVEIVGIVLMWSGAALAIWCSILMFLFGRGTPLVTSAPQKIMARNIYGMVRNPMMWALFIVVLGEAFTFGQPVLFLWLAAMSRIIYLIVVNYEEPQLERRFGESWKEYCEKVPAWFPKFN